MGRSSNCVLADLPWHELVAMCMCSKAIDNAAVASVTVSSDIKRRAKFVFAVYMSVRALQNAI